MIRSVAVMAALFVVAGCGQKSLDAPTERAAAASESGSADGASPTSKPARGATEVSTPPTTRDAVPANEPAAQAATKAGDSPVPGAPTPQDEAPRFNNRLPLTATITPECARRGSTILVEMKTRPHAGIVGMASFSDRQSHNTHTLGQADREGTYRWPFTVPAKAPFGRAQIDVLGEDRTPGPTEYEASSNGDNVHAVFSFEVSKSC